MQKLETRASFRNPINVPKGSATQTVCRATKPVTRTDLDSRQFLGLPADFGNFLRDGLTQAVALFYQLVGAPDLSEFVLQHSESFRRLKVLDWSVSEICADLSEPALDPLECLRGRRACHCRLNFGDDGVPELFEPGNEAQSYEIGLFDLPRSPCFRATNDRVSGVDRGARGYDIPVRYRLADHLGQNRRKA